MALRTTQTDQGVIFPVKTVPGSSRRRLAGVLGDALKVNVAAPPEKGRANKELLGVLAEAIGCSRGDLEIVAGAGNPRKDVLVRHLTADGLLERLKPHLA